MQYVGIDWAYRRAAWCAMHEGGAISDEGMVAADEDGLARLVLTVGPEVRACVEMMSGAVWVRDRLAAAGWKVEVAARAQGQGTWRRWRARPTRSTRGCWPSCAGAIWCPAVWLPSLDDRALRERLRAADASGADCARRRATGSSGC